MLILQLANSGNLRKYLERKQYESIYKISWSEVIQIANGIINGLKYLHLNDIIHRDLHSKNILMNDGKVLIADFGVSKQLNDAVASSSGVTCMPAYTDPNYLREGIKYEHSKKSDIYSLGVLLWELTSGVPPFNGFTKMTIAVKILQNEKVIANTPTEYVNIYTKCWSSEPEQRPSLDKIEVDLNKSSVESAVNIITNDITAIEKNNLMMRLIFLKDSSRVEKLYRYLVTISTHCINPVMLNEDLRKF